MKISIKRVDNVSFYDVGAFGKNFYIRARNLFLGETYAPLIALGNFRFYGKPRLPVT